MRSLVPRLLFSLLCCALTGWPVECRAQSPARARRGDEDPLAATLRLAAGKEGPEKDNVLVQLARAHLDAGRLEEAIRAASALDDGGEKPLLLSRVANAFADAGSLERAAEVLAEALRAGRRDSDSNTLSQLLDEVVGGETRYEAEDPVMMRRVLNKGALARLVEAGRADDAAKILSEVRDVALDPDFDDDDAARVLARVARLYLVSDASKASQALSESLAAARRIEDKYIRIPVLCEVAEAHHAAGDARAAESLLDEALQFALALGDDGHRDLRGVVRAYAAAGLASKAQKAAGHLDGEAGALAALDAAGAGAPPAALKENLSRAVEAAALVEEEHFRAPRLSELAVLYGAESAELLGKVEAAARAMSDGYSRGQVLLAVGDAHAKAKRRAEALDAWGRGLEAARSVELKREDYGRGDSRINDRQKTWLLGAAARRLVGAGEYGRAAEVARDIWAARARAQSLAEGSPAVAGAAEFELARLADELTRAGRKAEALEVLGVGAGAAGPGRNASAYELAPGLAALGATYARAGDEARAQTCLRRALQMLAESDFDGGDKLMILSRVAPRYAEAGLKPDARARKLLRRVVREVESER